MRDFRDAKAMAQTLREALNARSVSLTHSKSLELIARILGFRDWNALSARIRASTGRKALPSHRKIQVNPAILEEYAGFYRLTDYAILTVTREADHLRTSLTGQGEVAFHAETPTEFLADVVDARITMIQDDGKRTIAAVLQQGGVRCPLQRIDAVMAEQIIRRSEEKVRSQSPTAGSDEALRRLIDGAISGKPNYDEMNAALAEATREQLVHLQPGLARFGAVDGIKFVGVSPQGEDVYSVRHANGASHWRIALDTNGIIASAWVTPGP